MTAKELRAAYKELDRCNRSNFAAARVLGLIVLAEACVILIMLFVR